MAHSAWPSSSRSAWRSRSRRSAWRPCRRWSSDSSRGDLGRVRPVSGPVVADQDALVRPTEPPRRLGEQFQRSIVGLAVPVGLHQGVANTVPTGARRPGASCSSSDDDAADPTGRDCRRGSFDPCESRWVNGRCDGPRVGRTITAMTTTTAARRGHDRRSEDDVGHIDPTARPPGSTPAKPCSSTTRPPSWKGVGAHPGAVHVPAACRWPAGLVAVVDVGRCHPRHALTATPGLASAAMPPSVPAGSVALSVRSPPRPTRSPRRQRWRCSTVAATPCGRGDLAASAAITVHRPHLCGMGGDLFALDAHARR